MPSNETELGWLTYPNRGDEPWWNADEPQHENPDDMGLVQWLQRIELLGLPTYATFGDLPDPSTPESDGEQRQFAAVASDRLIYRTDGTAWEPWPLPTHPTEAEDLYVPEGHTLVLGGSLHCDSIEADGTVIVA